LLKESTSWQKYKYNNPIPAQKELLIVYPLFNGQPVPYYGKKNYGLVFEGDLVSTCLASKLFPPFGQLQLLMKREKIGVVFETKLIGFLCTK